MDSAVFIYCTNNYAFHLCLTNNYYKLVIIMHLTMKKNCDSEMNVG